MEAFIFLSSFFHLELFTPSTYANLASKEKICVEGPRWSEMGVFSPT